MNKTFSGWFGALGEAGKTAESAFMWAMIIMIIISLLSCTIMLGWIWGFKIHHADEDARPALIKKTKFIVIGTICGMLAFLIPLIAWAIFGRFSMVSDGNGNIATPTANASMIVDYVLAALNV